MKKTIAILLTISILTFCFIGTALADNEQKVTIGKQEIVLGMSKSEVKGGRQIKTNQNWNYGVWDVLVTEKGYSDDASNDVPGDFLVSDTSFAGFDNCKIIYSFDNNGTLESVVIVIDAKDLKASEPKNRKNADNSFSLLDEALSKYGSPIATGNEYIVFSKDCYDAVATLKERAFQGTSSGVMWYDHFSTELVNATQRLVNQGDSYVDIKLIEFHRLVNHEKVVTPFSSDYTKKDNYGVILSYTLCTKEAVDAIIKDGQDRQNSLNNDV